MADTEKLIELNVTKDDEVYQCLISENLAEMITSADCDPDIRTQIYDSVTNIANTSGSDTESAIESDTESDTTEICTVEKEETSLEESPMLLKESQNITDKSHNDIEESQNHLDKSHNDIEDSQNHLDKSHNDIEESQNHLDKSHNDIEESQNHLDKSHNDIEESVGMALEKSTNLIEGSIPEKLCSDSKMEEPTMTNIKCFSSEEDLILAIKQEELATNVKYVTRKSNFKVKDVHSLTGHKIRFDDATHPACPIAIPYDGVPFIITGSYLYECHLGPKHRQAPVHPYSRTGHTKKLNCPSKIRVKKVLKFPQYKVEGSGTEWKRRMLSKKLKSMFDSTKTHTSVMYYASFNTGPEEHNHQTGEKAPTYPIRKRRISPSTAAARKRRINARKAVTHAKVELDVAEENDLSESLAAITHPTECDPNLSNQILDPVTCTIETTVSHPVEKSQNNCNIEQSSMGLEDSLTITLVESAKSVEDSLRDKLCPDSKMEEPAVTNIKCFSSEEDLTLAIENEELATNSKYVKHRSPKTPKDLQSLTGHAIRFEDVTHPDLHIAIPYDGVPYIITGSFIYECHLGPRHCLARSKKHSRYTQPVDKRISNLIKKLAVAGNWNTSNLKSIIDDYSREIAPDVPISNRRFYPTKKVIQYHLYQARAKVKKTRGTKEAYRLKKMSGIEEAYRVKKTFAMKEASGIEETFDVEEASKFEEASGFEEAFDVEEASGVEEAFHVEEESAVEEGGSVKVSARVILQQCLSTQLMVQPASEYQEAQYVQINRGLIVYICFMKGATETILSKMVKSILGARLSEGDGGKLVSVLDLPGDVLIIPEATLSGSLRRKMMQYHENIDKVEGLHLYTKFVQLCNKAMTKSGKCREKQTVVRHGTYGNRQVFSTQTNGPYTHILEF